MLFEYKLAKGNEFYEYCQVCVTPVGAVFLNWYGTGLSKLKYFFAINQIHVSYVVIFVIFR